MVIGSMKWRLESCLDTSNILQRHWWELQAAVIMSLTTANRHVWSTWSTSDQTQDPCIPSPSLYRYTTLPPWQAMPSICGVGYGFGCSIKEHVLLQARSILPVYLSRGIISSLGQSMLFYLMFWTYFCCLLSHCWSHSVSDDIPISIETRSIASLPNTWL